MTQHPFKSNPPGSQVRFTRLVVKTQRFEPSSRGLGSPLLSSQASLAAESQVPAAEVYLPCLCLTKKRYGGLAYAQTREVPPKLGG